MVPEQADLCTFWEHIYRYRFATKFARNRRVLDIACGEGYGSAALARVGASKVIGIDISVEACAHAKKKYGLDARVGDAQEIPVADRSIDLLVSFETLEHLPKPELFIDECARILAPGGTAIISTPNRDAYREYVPNNPYHLTELSESEFGRLLRRRFATIQMFTQRPKSAAWWSTRAFASERTGWTGIPGFFHSRPDGFRYADTGYFVV